MSDLDPNRAKLASNVMWHINDFLSDQLQYMLAHRVLKSDLKSLEFGTFGANLAYCGPKSDINVSLAPMSDDCFLQSVALSFIKSLKLRKCQTKVGRGEGEGWGRDHWIPVIFLVYSDELFLVMSKLNLISIIYNRLSFEDKVSISYLKGEICGNFYF